MDDYKNRTYLSAIEAAKYLGVTVKAIHKLTRENVLEAQIATSGQKRYSLEGLKAYRELEMGGARTVS
ncbi:MAG: hypothetical protein JSV49_00240, partial [Thermoplasmata archaeon]